ncbi:transmembrane emp24 domain-containing protein 1-like [Maniola hyperantus]|uniref:transmembrane emp24 domain-containing protein 1-like n=1 Tax=Aphantopus hyperantus TaxID=2795564 RepID=UPI00156A38E9|nr:transmembrane emp24 domain-containing protein 1-like [Maniola hyperantus]
MYPLIIWIVIVIGSESGAAQEFYETDVNFRVDAGTTTCFFEKGEAGQTMELYYQVLDGQHGDLDISVDVTDPTGASLVADYKQSQNSIVMELAHDGDYMFCLDNTYSIMNSKLVFVYVVIEDRIGYKEETVVSTVDRDGKEHVEEEIQEWIGTDEEGKNYTIAVMVMIESMKRMLGHVVHARHMLDMYAATKSRDSYSALEDTFVVDVWSAFQIVFMTCVGMLQVYMIKKLFESPCPIATY